MNEKKVDNILIENARITFKNFAGKPDKFNPQGSRNFCVLLDPDFALKLKEDGWNIRTLAPRDPEDQPQPYMQVGVRFDVFPPNIYLIAGGQKTRLDENSVATLDYAEIENIDLVIRPHVWEMGGNTGVKAYAKTMYVTIVEDPLAEKYKYLGGDSEDGEAPF